MRCIAGSYAELHCECEVSVVLLLMLIDPHPLKTKKEFSQVLQKYTWSGNKEGERRANHMNDELFILLQSFVVSFRNNNFFHSRDESVNTR